MVSPFIKLISTLQGLIALKEMAALEIELYGIKFTTFHFEDGGIRDRSTNFRISCENTFNWSSADARILYHDCRLCIG